MLKIDDNIYLSSDVMRVDESR